MSEHLDLWIDAYLDGELSVEMRVDVERHLQTCSACRGLLAERERLVSWLRQVPATEPLHSEAQFLRALEAKIMASPARKASWLTIFKQWLPDERFQFLAWGAGSLALLLASLFFQTTGLLQRILALVPGVHQEVLSQFAAAPPLPQLALPDTLAGFLGLSGWFNPAGWFSLLNLTWISNWIVLGLLGLLNSAWLAAWLAKKRLAPGGQTER